MANVKKNLSLRPLIKFGEFRYLPPKMKRRKALLITGGYRDQGGARIRVLNHFDRMTGQFYYTWAPRIGILKRDTFFERVVFAFLKAWFTIKRNFCILFVRYDLVYIQTMFLEKWQFEQLKQKGAIICFDFDDAIYSYSKEEFEIVMQYVDKVIVATPHLRDYIKPYNKACRVVFSPVNTDVILPLNRVQDIFTIGWIGSPWTAPYLKNIEPVFKKMSGKIPFKLLIVGGEMALPGIDIECITWSEQAEVEALGRIDIGIMPLSNDEWSKMKGGYKLYLYMAAGKPAVASPYGINADIVIGGETGFLAETEKDWLSAFEKLQQDVALRREMGLKARKIAEQKYSYNVCTKQLLDFLNE